MEVALEDTKSVSRRHYIHFHPFLHQEASQLRGNVGDTTKAKINQERSVLDFFSLAGCLAGIIHSLIERSATIKRPRRMRK